MSSLLKEGYSTTNVLKFIPEFRNRLQRLSRVHQKIKGNTTSVSALRDFIELSRQPCKLTLARYLFTPEEIVGEIFRELQISEGLVDFDLYEPEFIKGEIAHATGLLPDFEARILKRLCATSGIYWVSDTTSSRINSLVEYPTTTVVLVIKLPGSDIEFEIKRAGRRGETHSISFTLGTDTWWRLPTGLMAVACNGSCVTRPTQHPDLAWSIGWSMAPKLP